VPRRIRVHPADLRRGVHHGSGPGATRQTAEHVEGAVGGARSAPLHVAHEVGYRVPELLHAHREQEPAEPTLLSAGRLHVQAADDLAPAFPVAYPRPQVVVGLEIVDDIDQVGLSDQEPVLLRQLDRLAKYSPRGVAIAERRWVGVHQHIVEYEAVRSLVPVSQIHRFAE
jgi:hypothetical protein